MKLSAIIVAGGTGQRFGSQIPKQFLLLKGLPVLMHSIKRFYDYNPETHIIVTLPAEYFDFWQELCSKHQFNIAHKVVAGGETRFHSVKSGLAAISNEGLVAIHDAVRPLVSDETLKRCIDTAQLKGNAIPVIPMIDSLRKLENDSSVQVKRDEYVAVQTPQVFDTVLINKAYMQVYSPAFTDDASVLEKMQIAIHLVEGNRENIKITNQMDLEIAEVLMKA